MKNYNGRKQYYNINNQSQTTKVDETLFEATQYSTTPGSISLSQNNNNHKKHNLKI